MRKSGVVSPMSLRHVSPVADGRQCAEALLEILFSPENPSYVAAEQRQEAALTVL